jgi:hypothetical protein
MSMMLLVLDVLTVLLATQNGHPAHARPGYSGGGGRTFAEPCKGPIRVLKLINVSVVLLFHIDGVK